MQIKPVYFPEQDIAELQQVVGDILRSGRLTLGDYTKKFEEEFSKITGSRYAVAINSGTSALEIILRSLNLKGSSVIVPTNTFAATAFAVIAAGATPIFADINESLSLDPQSLLDNLQKDIKAVVLVHIGGFISPHIEQIANICREKNIYLIEDAAHAHGSSFNKKAAGSFGIANAFSFYPTKVITSAEGGMIVTDDENIYKRALIFRDQGKQDFSSNYHVELGYNWRLSEIHAALGLWQTRRLAEFITSRRKIANIYNEGLKDSPMLRPMPEAPGVFSNYYKYVAYLTNTAIVRDVLKKELKEKFQVGLMGEAYQIPCHQQPVFQEYAKGKSLPAAEKLCATHICLPMSATMTEAQAQEVIKAINITTKSI